MKYQLVFSSEHHSNSIPDQLISHFASSKEQLEKLMNYGILSTHRGWDLGIPLVVEAFEKEFQMECTKAKYSRLLVDLNRSPGHKNLFSEFTRNLLALEKENILSQFYRPHRMKVEQEVNDILTTGKIAVHIAFHSFTPSLDGVERNASVGLLYDPKHKWESKLCNEWKNIFQSRKTPFRIRSNYPYLGTADSLPTYLRKKYKENYLGIELELNQDLFTPTGKAWVEKNIMNHILDSFRSGLNHCF